MAIPNLILGNGEVLIRQTNSNIGLYSPDNKTGFGLVEAVCPTSDKVSIGDSVLYDKQMGRSLMYGSTMYVLIKEQHITGNEIVPP